MPKHVLTAHHVATAIIWATSEEEYLDIVKNTPRHIDGFPLKARTMAAVALVDVGFENTLVRRCVGLSDIQLPSSIHAIKRHDNRHRAMAARAAVAGLIYPGDRAA